MSDPTPNVKIYDRPERKFSPVALVLIVLVAAVCAFLLYRTLRPAAPAPAGFLLPAVLGAAPAQFAEFPGLPGPGNVCLR